MNHHKSNESCQLTCWVSWNDSSHHNLPEGVIGEGRSIYLVSSRIWQLPQNKYSYFLFQQWLILRVMLQFMCLCVTQVKFINKHSWTVPWKAKTETYIQTKTTFLCVSSQVSVLSKVLLPVEETKQEGWQWQMGCLPNCPLRVWAVPP